MNKQFDILKANRLLIIRIINDCTLEQINKTPDGFNNNIAWNIAHLVVTQQLLCYKFANIPMYVSDDLIAKYRKGTAPQNDLNEQEFEEIKTQFLMLPDKIEEDFQSNIFKTYQSYTTSVNVSLNSISDAIEFNNFHEGIHLGSILALKKLV